MSKEFDEWWKIDGHPLWEWDSLLMSKIRKAFLAGQKSITDRRCAGCTQHEGFEPDADEQAGTAWCYWAKNRMRTFDYCHNWSDEPKEKLEKY